MDTNVDRITKLPDYVTTNILPRIPTIEAVRTCVLFRGWEHKWASIYDIDIIDGGLVDDTDEFYLRALFEMETRLASFNSFMDKVLDANPELSVRNVRLDLGTIAQDSHNLNTWISKIVSRHVKNLSFVALTQHGVVLPKIIECSPTLTELELVMDCTLNICVLNCFPKLECLYLSGGSDGRIQITNKQSPESGTLLLSLAALKHLELERFEFMNAKVVEINVPELVSFKASSAKKTYGYVVKINAPKLARFVMAQVPVCEFVQCSMLSLCDMDLYVGRKASPLQVIALLKAAKNLKCLRLGWESPAAIRKWRSRHGHVLPTFNQLNRLAFRNYMYDDILSMFIYAAPYLESLDLSIVYGYDYGSRPMTLQDFLEPSAVSGLREVKITWFDGYSWQFELLKMLIQNGKNLESVVFYLTNSSRTSREIRIIRLMIALRPENWSCVTLIDQKRNGDKRCLD